MKAASKNDVCKDMQLARGCLDEEYHDHGNTQDPVLAFSCQRSRRVVRRSILQLDLEWKEKRDVLISKLATINQKIGDLGYSTMNRELFTHRTFLMKAIIRTCAQPAGRKKQSGWNTIVGLGLKGGSPSSSPVKDFIFANDSSNESSHSDDFELANSSSEDASNSNEERFLNPLTSILYPIIEASPAQYSELIIPGVECSKFCKKTCSCKFNMWSDAEVQSLKDSFTVRNKTELKNKLLSQLLFQKSAGLPVTGFFYSGHLYCAKFFSHITGISLYHINLVSRDFASDYKRYIHGNSNRRKNIAARVTFISWMKIASENYGQNGPTDIGKSSNESNSYFLNPPSPSSSACALFG